MRNALLLLFGAAMTNGCIIYDEPGGVVVGPTVVTNAAPYFSRASATVVLGSRPGDDWLDLRAVVDDPNGSFDIVDVYVDVWDAYDSSPHPLDSFDLYRDSGSNTRWIAQWDVWETNLIPDYYSDYYLSFYVFDAYGDGEELTVDFTFD